MFRAFTLCLWILFSSVLLCACEDPPNIEKAAHAQDKAPEPGSVAAVVPANVKTQIVEASTLVEEILALGSTGADKDIRFSAEMAGRLEFLGADVGDTVKKGQVLARIDYQMQKA